MSRTRANQGFQFLLSLQGQPEIGWPTYPERTMLHQRLLDLEQLLKLRIRLAFHLLFRGRRLRFEVRATEATYRLLDGLPLVVRHHDEEILLLVDDAVARPIPGRTPLKLGPRRSS